MRENAEPAASQSRERMGAPEAAEGEQPSSWALNNLGLTYLRRKQYAEAADTFNRALALATQGGDEWMAMVVELNLADLLIDLGESARAEEICQRLVTVAAARHDLVRQVAALKCRARVHTLRRRPEQALRDLREARGLARTSGELLPLAEVLKELGSTAWSLGYIDEADRCWAEAHDLFSRCGPLSRVQEVASLRATLEAESRRPSRGGGAGQ